VSLWRVGRSLGRTLYRDEALVGMVDTPELAREIVDAMNGALSLGSELWFQRYKAETNTFVPHFAGKVTALRGSYAFAGGKWHLVAYPHWTSEEEARKACDGRGPVMPSIK
jgi:hypothetical protein